MIVTPVFITNVNLTIVTLAIPNCVKRRGCSSRNATILEVRTVSPAFRKVLKRSIKYIVNAASQ